MSLSKLVASNGATAALVGIVVWWMGGQAPPWLDKGGEVDISQARVSAVNAICELGATARQAHRNAVNEALQATGHCSVAHCDGEPPAACPPDTVLAETGEPAALPVDELVEKEKLKEELREEVKEEVEGEVKAEAAAAAEAEASEKAAEEQ